MTEQMATAQAELATPAPQAAAEAGGTDGGDGMSNIEWVDTSPKFGTAWEFGCCNARERGAEHTLCGWPRRADGTCGAGHPAEPGWTPDPHTPAAVVAAGDERGLGE